MKRVLALVLLFAMTAPVFAIEDGEVTYTGGTVVSLKEGTTGKFDTTSQSALTFESSGSKVAIPYERVQSYQYSRVLARHYGALATIAIVLVKYRQRRHFVRINYLDDSGTAQVAIFEIPKTMPQTLMAVLQTRAPQGCKPNSFGFDTNIGTCPIPKKMAVK
jgi:hypothetical protein